MTTPPRYVTVLLPLALPKALTYSLPLPLAAKAKVGVRVVVPLGKRRFYTAIAVALHTVSPEPDIELKEVCEVVDEAPVVTIPQLHLWKWMADYYMCTAGEVMKAALPSGLKLESETLLVRNADFCEDEAHPLTPRERQLYDALAPQKARSLEAVERELRSGSLLATARRLMALEAVSVRESLSQAFKPRTETHVRLCRAYASQEQLNALFPTLKRAPAQEALLLSYLDASHAATAISLHNASLLKEVSKRDLLQAFEGSGEAAFNALRKKGVIETYAYEVGRLRTLKPVEGVDQRPLNEEQQRAANAIRESFATHRVCLLHGVTSSGKTEVYIHLIREAIARGEQVLYLVPEIALTTQITTRLGRVFGDKMGVYHSKFPDAERVELWQRQLSPQAFPLILGVRSSVFLPFQRLGLVIVDEEHETSYKQQDPAPRYNARDTAIVLAAQNGARVLLGTATPSLESYRHATDGKYGLVRMLHRYGHVQMPEIVVEDVKELRRTKQMKTPFSPRLTHEVREALSNGEQAILFQNRRGYSPVMECRTCGWTPKCTHCDVTLTFHQKMGRLVCHYCGATYDVPQRCPCCEGTDLRDMGYGTEKIEAAAQSVFPEAHLSRMDLDTTRSRTAYEKLIDDFQNARTDVLIGTQMVTKGLDFERVRVVGILNADQMLNLPDFRAHERAFQMMSQVAGRAGRRGKQGLVVLQTRQPELPVVGHVVRADYDAMYREQMEEREAFHYPPFYRLVYIYFKHRYDQTADHAAETYATLIRPHFEGCVLGPDRPEVGRIQSLFIRKIVLKVRPDLPPQGVRATLLAARDATLAEPGMKSLTIVFDVDPL